MTTIVSVESTITEPSGQRRECAWTCTSEGAVSSVYDKVLPHFREDDVQVSTKGNMLLVKLGEVTPGQSRTAIELIIYYGLSS